MYNIFQRLGKEYTRSLSGMIYWCDWCDSPYEYVCFILRHPNVCFPFVFPHYGRIYLSNQIQALKHWEGVGV